MDGNARWAKQRALPIAQGHQAGIEALRKVLKLAVRDALRVLTVFAFSSENWQRPGQEIHDLMNLFAAYLDSELNTLHKDGIKVRFIGARERFNPSLLEQMKHAEYLTADNTRMTLVVAVDYGGQWDITQAAKQLAKQVQNGQLTIEAITISTLDQYMALADLPKPDLFIRTSNMYRLSNFLLWQLAYTELYFTETLWPDFDECAWDKALHAYSQRNRLYGMR